LRSFIPNFVEIVKDLTYMLKKDNDVKWYSKSIHSFEQIKKALGEAPFLVSPNYYKGFLIFSFAYENIIFAVIYIRMTRIMNNQLCSLVIY